MNQQPEFPVLNYQDFISADGESMTTDSRKVAAVFGKQHRHVLEVIRKRLADAGAWGVPNFRLTHYVDPQNGQTYPTYEMTKDGFTFLVQKFSGKKAVQFQIAYIEAFNAMAEQIKNQRLGLQFRHFELQLIHKGKKAKASISGRDLNLWKGEKRVIEGAITALEEKMNPQLSLTVQ